MPDTITVPVEIPGWMAERLNVLVDEAGGLPDLATVIDKLLDHVQQGIVRPGSWERGWLEQAFGDEWLRGLEPDTERTAGDGRVIFQRPATPCPNDPRCDHGLSAHVGGARYCMECGCGGEPGTDGDEPVKDAPGD